MKTIPSVLLITQLCTLSTEARLWKKTRELHRKRASDDGGDVAASTRIVGGGEAIEDRYSYAVSFQAGGHFCGGSLIARDLVLSAAHCKDTDGDNPRYDAIVGRHDHDEFWDGDRIDAVREFIHPYYDETTNDYDIMVVKLERPTTEDVVPVKINSSSSSPQASASVHVIGWGVTETGYTSDELKEVEVSVVSQSQCRSSYGFNIITDSMLCAADLGEDSCQGDSGGPLLLKGNRAEDDIQVGVVSWGYGCADSYYPGVYSRVSSSYDWIKDRVCENSQDEDALRRFQCPSSSGSAPAPAQADDDDTDDLGLFDDDTDDSELIDDDDDNDFIKNDDNTDDMEYFDDDSNDDDWWNSWTDTVSTWFSNWWS